MATTVSWLIERQVLFITPSRYFDPREFQQLTQHVENYIRDITPDESVYIIHDLRSISTFGQIVKYLDFACTHLTSNESHVLVAPEDYWAFERGLLRFIASRYIKLHLVYSLDDSFQCLQALDPNLPNLRVTFRTRVRELLRAPFVEAPALAGAETAT